MEQPNLAGESGHLGATPDGKEFIDRVIAFAGPLFRDYMERGYAPADILGEAISLLSSVSTQNKLRQIAERRRRERGVSDMNFWVEVRLVGGVMDIDSLAKNLGYDKEEVTLVTDSQDVEPIRDFLGRQGKLAGIEDFGGFFLVARDGDYVALWGFCGSIPYNEKDVYEIKWRLIDRNAQAVLKRRFKNRKRGLLDGKHTASCYHIDCDEDDQSVHGCGPKNVEVLA